MPAKNIAIISIPVTDQDRAARFYADVFGFQIVFDDPMGPDQRWLMMKIPTGETSITLVTWFDSMPPGSMQGAVMSCEGLAATRARILGLGVDVSEIQSAPWGDFCTLKDPDGNGWVLQE